MRALRPSLDATLRAAYAVQIGCPADLSSPPSLDATLWATMIANCFPLMTSELAQYVLDTLVFPGVWFPNFCVRPCRPRAKPFSVRRTKLKSSNHEHLYVQNPVHRPVAGHGIRYQRDRGNQGYGRRTGASTAAAGPGAGAPRLAGKRDQPAPLENPGDSFREVPAGGLQNRDEGSTLPGRLPHDSALFGDSPGLVRLGHLQARAKAHGVAVQRGGRGLGLSQLRRPWRGGSPTAPGCAVR